MFNWIKKKLKQSNMTVKTKNIEQYNPDKDGGVRLKSLLINSKFIYRDTTLKENIIDKYQVGLFFKEPTLCDATAKFGGINGNVRFLIVTSTPKDISTLSQNPEFSHSIIGEGEIYKIIGIIKNKTFKQITILHIPTEFRSYFESSDAKTFEDMLLKSTDEDFLEACSTKINSDLLHKDWVDRVKQPIGLDLNNKVILAENTNKALDDE